MAQNFNIVYTAAKETAYANDGSALVVAAALNSTVRFIPLLASNGKVDMGATTAEYIVQRIKRIKSTTVANPNANTTSAALAVLDGFSSVTWESTGMATGIMKQIGIKTGINEEFNMTDLTEDYKKSIDESVALSVLERHEDIIETLFNASTSKGTLAYVKGDTAVFDAVTASINEIMLFSDEFKHMTSLSNMVIVMHPVVADWVTKEIGTVFNQEAPIYTTGFKSKMSINGVPVIVDATLNKYQGADDKERLGFIVTDVEALAFTAANETKPIVADFGIVKFAGKVFYNVTHAADPARIKHWVFDATNFAGQTDKASD